jgi:serine protease Do
MKKIRVLFLFLLIAISTVACSSVSGLETTTVVTTVPETTTYTGQVDEGSKIYVYDSYDDLVSQIYQDVYDEIYQSIYDSVSSMLTEQLYEEIYQQVTSNITSILSEEDINVYIQDFQNQIYAVADIVKTSVIGISSYEGTTGLALGSGVVYFYNPTTNTYFFITNNHVVVGGDNFKVVFADSSSVVATLLGVDENIDIAILSFSGAGLEQNITVSQLGSSTNLASGTVVLAAGNPKGYDFYGSLTMGIIAGVNRDVEGDGVVGYIQHDASINSGNSGGPLYTLDGKVIGINVSKYSSTDIEGMGFAIPIDLVKTVIQTIAPATLPTN